jgi:hypothetical protein
MYHESGELGNDTLSLCMMTMIMVIMLMHNYIKK